MEDLIGAGGLCPACAREPAGVDGRPLKQIGRALLDRSKLFELCAATKIGDRGLDSSIDQELNMNELMGVHTDSHARGGQFFGRRPRLRERLKRLPKRLGISMLRVNPGAPVATAPAVEPTRYQ